MNRLNCQHMNRHIIIGMNPNYNLRKRYHVCALKLNEEKKRPLTDVLKTSVELHWVSVAYCWCCIVFMVFCMKHYGF